MLNSAATGITSSIERTETEPDQPTKTRRQHENSEEENGHCNGRYFLGKAGSNGGTPSLEKEIATEGEAFVESLRQGARFMRFGIRAIADLTGRRPQPVPAKKS